MQTSNKYKPNRSFLSHRRMRRDANHARNKHALEVKVSWRKFRRAFRNLALKGDVAWVEETWEDMYTATSYMEYTD